MTVSPSVDLVILDGDDTLWDAQGLYESAKQCFATLMRESGVAASNPVPLLDKIDSEAVASQGFTIDRFVGSMVTTYRMLSTKRGLPIDATVENKVRLLGRPLSQDYELYPDAVTALELLSAKFKLVLATKGEHLVQARKIEQLQIAQYFDRVYTLEWKTRKEYLQILSDLSAQPANACAIGNSVRSDINPATAIGMRAVLIKRPNWRYERASLRRRGKVVVVDSLSNAANAVLTMASRFVAI